MFLSGLKKFPTLPGGMAANICAADPLKGQAEFLTFMSRPSELPKHSVL